MSSYVVLSSMGTDSVSKDFFNACAMMHEMVDELYESLHDNFGNPPDGRRRYHAANQSLQE